MGIAGATTAAPRRCAVLSVVRHAIRAGLVLAALLLVLGGGRVAEARYASIVIEHETGRVLQAQAADVPTYPASLTKMMTAYLTFEALRTGRLQLGTRLPVSARAASRPPSKLGLVAGSTIRVEDALRAILTKSANDAAVVLAEAIAGSEEAFAERMTRTARALGMRRTVFKNASGLPDRGQVTTARDMARLASRLIRDHARHYHFFSQRSFTYAGRPQANHNRLLGRYPGVDGLKTGYIAAAGYNLAASAVRNGRRLIAVMLGGASPRLRDRQVMALLDQGFVALGVPSALPGEVRRLAKRERPKAGRLNVATLPPEVAAMADAPAAVPAPRPRDETTPNRAETRIAAAAARRVPVPMLRARLDEPDDGAPVVAGARPGDLGAEIVAAESAAEGDAAVAEAHAGAIGPAATAAVAPAAAGARLPEAPFPRRRTLAIAEAGVLAGEIAGGALGAAATVATEQALAAVDAATRRALGDDRREGAGGAGTFAEPTAAVEPGLTAVHRPQPRPETLAVVASDEPPRASGPVPRRRPEQTRATATAAERRYAVQVGAFADRGLARRSAIRAGARLPDAISWDAIDIAPVRPGKRSLYQARLTGFDRSTAEQACAHLRRARLPCLVVQAGTG
jgi:D-alanyl-D-alanine carboxypeptidase